MCHFHCIIIRNWFRSYLNGLEVFATFLNVSPNLSIRSSWSEPQSSPCLVFADCIELLHHGCKEYNRSDFSIDHLVMSMCRVVSCVVRRGCLLWIVCSLGKTCSHLLCFILYSTKLVFLGIPWLSTFTFQSPVMKWTVFLVLVLEGLVGLQRSFQLQLLWHQWLGHRLGLLWLNGLP